MEVLGVVLKPLKVITELLLGDSYPVMSYVYPTLIDLFNKHLQTERCTTFIILAFKNYSRRNLYSTSETKHNENLWKCVHFLIQGVISYNKFKHLFCMSLKASLEIKHVYLRTWLKCFMSHDKWKMFYILMQYFRFKDLSFITDTSRTVIHATVQEYPAQLTDDKRHDESEQPSSKRACTLDQECASDIYSILFGDDQIDTSALNSSSRGKKSKIQQEMDTYLPDPLVSKRPDPLPWWRMNVNRLPLLSKLAKIFGHHCYKCTMWVTFFHRCKYHNWK